MSPVCTRIPPPLKKLRAVLAAFVLLFSPVVLAMSVTFINPGKSDEKFWVSVSRFMQVAADDLGITLEVLYAERDSTLMITHANQVIARANKPDYLVTVNEKQVAGEMLKLAADTGIKVFLINNTLSPEQQQALGKPRERLTNWIGSLEPNNEDAGYQMTKHLISAGHLQLPQKTHLNLFAIGGDKATPAGYEREAGLKRALAEHPEVELRQVVYGEWNQERAREQAEVLFKRYPDTHLVWCANDLMAFGAMAAASARGLAPGKEVFFSGLNNSVAAMELRTEGKLSSLASGHFSTGGWAMVLLYDYQHGRDFKEVGPLERVEPLFVMIDKKQARRFLEVFGESQFQSIDFKQFSRVLNPKLKEYRFSILPFLK